MKKATLYNQLSLHLLATNQNMHHGACVNAAAAIHRMPETPSAVQSKIDEKLSIWHGEDLLNLREETLETKTKCNVGPIVAAIEEVGDALHIVGHDIIQGSHALKSLHFLNAICPQDTVDQIAANVLKSGTAPPGMFYGYSSEKIREQEKEFDDYNAESSPIDVAYSLVTTLKKIKKSYFGFGLLAQETHLITHAEAIISLHFLGYQELYQRLLKTWFCRLKLLEIIYDLNLDDTHISPKRMNWDPRTTSFWEAYSEYELCIHPVKTMFSYLHLKHLGMFSSEDARFMEEEKLPLMADSRFPEDWQKPPQSS